ncbi:MAG: hypothetical protein ACR2IE_04900 [Candidatus Sumerlaeaceae bacterium]
MKWNRKRVALPWLYAIALPILLVGSIATAAERSGRFEDVELRISLSPTEIMVGQPVVLQLTMSNKATESGGIPVFSARLQLPEGNDLDIFVQAPGESETRLEGALESGLYSGSAIEVPPGRTIKHEMNLIYDKAQPNGYIFSKPGEYMMRAQVRFSLSTNPEPRKLALSGVKITVRAPEGPAAEAWKLINNPEAARALQLGKLPNDDIRQKFAEVGDKFPTTPYGKTCARVVAVSTAFGPKADMRQALPLLLKYEKTYRKETDSDLIAYTIAGAHHVQQEYDLAREWMYYMIDQYPQSTLLRKQDPLYKYYCLDPAEALLTFPWYLTEKPWIVPGSKPPTSLRPIQD